MKEISIPEALDEVVKNPFSTQHDDMVNTPVHRLIVEQLFRIANNPDLNVRGSETKAAEAIKMIVNRSSGLRRAGTSVITGDSDELQILDLGEYYGE